MTNQVQQSGNITPMHLAAWTTDGVIQDAGVSITNMQAVLSSSLLGVNFNLANNDNAILILLPAGFNTYRVNRVLISGASGQLTSSTAGVFTGVGGTGVTVVTTTAMTITSGIFDAANTLQSLTVNNQNTTALADAILYFRIGTAQGAPATANVTISYEPLP